ncbi:hypothetical protein ABEK93_15910 [Klebsiella pneumoniae]
MKQSRTRLSLAIISGILPLFFMLALIVPLWIFFTGERYFLSTLLHFAENEPDRRAQQTTPAVPDTDILERDGAET